MAVYFNQDADGGGSSALDYAYFNVGFGQPLLTSTPISIFAWIHTGSTPGSLGEAIVKFERVPPDFGGNFEYWMLSLGSDLTIRATQRGPVLGVDSATIGPLTHNTWHGVGAIFASNSSRFAVLDGVIGTERTVLVNTPSDLEDVVFGGSLTSTVGTNNRPWKGCIGPIGIWDIVLSEQNWIDLYNGTPVNEIEPDHLKFYIPFENEATASNAFLDGSPVTMGYKTYNSNPSAVGSIITTCETSPPVDTGCPDPQYVYTFSSFHKTDFLDWGTEALAPSSCEVDREAADFESYFHTYYHLTDDTMFWMYSPYILTYLKNDSRNESDPSCFFQPVWEWSDSSSTSKFAEQLQIYKTRIGQTVVDSKNRVRGKGRALQLRYQSETGKDFNVLGWGIDVSKNTKP